MSNALTLAGLNNPEEERRKAVTEYNFPSRQKILFFSPFPISHLHIGNPVFVLVHWQVGLCYCGG